MKATDLSISLRVAPTVLSGTFVICNNHYLSTAHDPAQSYGLRAKQNKDNLKYLPNSCFKHVVEQVVIGESLCSNAAR